MKAGILSWTANYR